MSTEPLAQVENASSHETSKIAPPPTNIASETMERPRICLIDIESDTAAELRRRGYYCYTGTLGSIVEVNNTSQHSTRRCRINYNFPPNLHEYDIVIVDLQNETRVPYIAEEHIRSNVKGYTDVVLLSSYPEMQFDPRALAASFLRERLQPFIQKNSILVIFAAEQEQQEYRMLSITARQEKIHDPATHNLYNFFRNLPQYINKTGIDTRVLSKSSSELSCLLERHNKTFRYDIVFKHPTYWQSNSNPHAEDNNFIPLVEAQPGEVVSFALTNEENLTLLFPKVDRKLDFLTELLERVLPEICPTLFPFSTQFVWLSDPLYALPNEDSLKAQMAHLSAEYEAQRRLQLDQIEANHKKYGFLHDLLKQTGDDLVKTVEHFMLWLDFDSVENVDETNPDLKEEDLRIESDRGLLVVEVKGIGGTSTDAACAQVNKFKSRRMQALKRWDVFALYLVNHQRHLPPHSRLNPPFNDIQLEDANHDNRGILTTFDLFNLYFNIIEGHITKEDARVALYEPGLIRFKPSGVTLQLKPSEIHHNGSVIILDTTGVALNVGDSLVIDDSGRFSTATVLELQVDGKSVSSAESNVVGAKLSVPVTMKAKIWLKSDVENSDLTVTKTPREDRVD